jgi:hypothetical protein
MQAFWVLECLIIFLRAYPLLVALWAWPLEFVLLFVLLTIYGAMWKGAQDQGRQGWFVALLWSLGLLGGLHALGALAKFFAIPWP